MTVLSKTIPQHIAIIMDGNGRWAKKRFLPRVAGHVRGVKMMQEVVQHCSTLGVHTLSLFAFGRENWKRPPAEVSFLMSLLCEHLNKETDKLYSNNVNLRFIGDRTRLNRKIIEIINHAEHKTHDNTGLNLNIFLDYSGKYDIVQAVQRIIQTGITEINELVFASYLLTNQFLDPELVIRTSGEIRISNFMLWQLAYSELYFTKKHWPEFNKNELDRAIDWFNTRERRFGQITE